MALPEGNTIPASNYKMDGRAMSLKNNNKTDSVDNNTKKHKTFTLIFSFLDLYIIYI